MSLHVAAANPFRPVDWKWQRAMGVIDGSQPRPTRKIDTPVGHSWIRKAVVFKSELDACRTEGAKHLLSVNRPDIFWAYWAWSSNVNPMKHSIEAHLLARESNFEVGFRCGVAPEVIEAYEHLFFNVREKLQHTKYVLNCVMGPSIHRGVSEREYDLLWKLYGLFLGPHMLDALENKFVNPAWCGTPDGVSACIQDDAIGTLKLKAALAAKTVPVTQHTQLALLETFTKFVEVERTTDSQGKAQDQMLEHISAMLTSLPFNIGGRDPRNNHVAIDAGPLAMFNNSAVELTYEETMRVSVRQPIANAETLLALSFPQTLKTEQITAEVTK